MMSLGNSSPEESAHSGIASENVPHVEKALQESELEAPTLVDLTLGRRSFVQFIAALTVSPPISLTRSVVPSLIEGASRRELAKFSSTLTSGLLDLAKETEAFHRIAIKAFGFARETKRYLLEARIGKSGEIADLNPNDIEQFCVDSGALKASVHQFKRLSHVAAELRSHPLWNDFRDRYVGAFLDSRKTGRDSMLKRCSFLRDAISEAGELNDNQRDDILERLTTQVDTLTTLPITSREADQELYEIFSEIDEVVAEYNEATGSRFQYSDAIGSAMHDSFEKAQTKLLSSLGFSPALTERLVESLSEYCISLDAIVVGTDPGLPLGIIYEKESGDEFITTIDNLSDYWPHFKQTALEEAAYYDSLVAQFAPQLARSVLQGKPQKGKSEGISQANTLESSKETDSIFELLRDENVAVHSPAETGTELTEEALIQMMGDKLHLRIEERYSLGERGDRDLDPAEETYPYVVLLAKTPLQYTLLRSTEGGEADEEVTGALLTGDYLVLDPNCTLQSLAPASFEQPEGTVFRFLPLE